MLFWPFASQPSPHIIIIIKCKYVHSVITDSLARIKCQHLLLGTSQRKCKRCRCHCRFVDKCTKAHSQFSQVAKIRKYKKKKKKEKLKGQLKKIKSKEMREKIKTGKRTIDIYTRTQKHSQTRSFLTKETPHNQKLRQNRKFTYTLLSHSHAHTRIHMQTRTQLTRVRKCALLSFCNLTFHFQNTDSTASTKKFLLSLWRSHSLPLSVFIPAAMWLMYSLTFMLSVVHSPLLSLSLSLHRRFSCDF